MLGWREKSTSPLVDLHSHLIPGIDDGVHTLEDSIDILSKFKDLGYRKIITTPHIHPNYPNQPKDIKDGFLAVQKKMAELNIQLELEVGAEYFVDEDFMNMIKRDQEVLYFGDKYVLVESSFLNKPMLFESCMFELLSKGYTPILAHPERYRFLEGSLDWFHELKSMGVLLQVTIGSFVDFYGSTPKKIANELLKLKMIDFIGSDLHHYRHMSFLEEGLRQKKIRALIQSSLLKNNQLL